MKNWHSLSAVELNKRYCAGEFSLEEHIQNSIYRIDTLNKEIGAFTSVLRERALSRAREIDKKRKNGEKLGRLAGVTVGVKDNIHIDGELTTCASSFLYNYRAPFEATVCQLLEAEDAILIGKTNLDEFAMGSSTEHSSYGITRNPWDTNCVPGGSSGGSAAALGGRLCQIALGTDTGGSIRQPASFCGVVGYKPTYGRVSRYGLVAFGSSLDQIGPFTACVEDAALTMEIIGKHDDRDSTSSKHVPEKFTERMNESVQGKKIGVPWNFLENLTEESRKNFDQSLETLKELGAEIVEVNLDILKYSMAVYYILACAEAATNLARFDGIRYGRRSPNAKNLKEIYQLSKEEGFGFEVRNRIMLGTYVLSAGHQDSHYKKALKMRTLIIEKYKEAFAQCDVIAMPVCPSPAFEIGQIQDPLQMYLQDIYTISINLAGLPAISVPSGFNDKGRPFGLQIVGKQLCDGDVLSFARSFEKANDYSSEIPKEFNVEVTR